ncbi:MAG TPA: hypothetical protein VF477_16690 [Mycobacterium sp.]
MSAFAPPPFTDIDHTVLDHMALIDSPAYAKGRPPTRVFIIDRREDPIEQERYHGRARRTGRGVTDQPADTDGGEENPQV